MSEKTIGDMTPAEAHERNVSSMADGVKMGIFTEKGAEFTNNISALIRDGIAAIGLSAADFALLQPAIAELSIAYQGLLDMRGPEKRTSLAASKFMVDSLVFMKEHIARSQAAKNGGVSGEFAQAEGGATNFLN
jgi:hypothetical protein